MYPVHFLRSLAIQAVAVSVILGACTTRSATPPATTCNLEPALSDAGVVGCVTLADDLVGGRDGGYDIVGVAADASSCSFSSDGSEFTAVAQNQSVPTGKVSRLSVTVPAGSMQQAAGSADIAGRVSFDFAGAVLGSTYTGDASQDDGHSTIAIAWAAGRLTFDFTGVTAANAVFSGKVVCLATGPGPGGDGGETVIVAFSDPSALDEGSWDAYQPLLETTCRSAQPADQPSFGQAMADVRGWLDSATGGGLSALEASGEFADEAIASAGAAELVTGGDFAAALALTLQANRAEPDDPRHLVNAAGLLVALDRPTDALAFLDQAANMRSPDVTPMGIDQDAVALANRGVALSAQGRYGEAADALRSSLADPNLTEAADNLAQAEVCLGNGRAAFARVSLRRIDQVSRLPQGTPGTLPGLKLPARPADTVALSELYQQLVDLSIDRLLARMQRQQALVSEGQTRYEAPASLARVQSIRHLIALAEGLPEIQALWGEVSARQIEVSRITFDMWGTAGALEMKSYECGASIDCLRAWCVPETQSRHAQWRGAFDSYETALRDAYAALVQRETALAGLAADPVWFEVLSLDIQDTADRWFYGYLAGEALQWSRLTAVNASLCIDAGGEDPGTPPEEPRSEATPCDPQRFPNGLMPMIRFPGAKAMLKLGANCEEITAEVSGPGIDQLGLLRPFAQVKGTGKGITVFAGIKAGVTMEPVSLSGKMGAYWTVDYQGNVRDYGVRVAPSTFGVESGPFGIRVWEAEAMDFSFVGIADYMPLIGTQ